MVGWGMRGGGRHHCHQQHPCHPRQVGRPGTGCVISPFVYLSPSAIRLSELTSRSARLFLFVRPSI